MSDSTAARAHLTPLADDVTLAWDDRAAGRPFLLLHGGAGPGSVLPFATLLARHGRVITPTHPGFAAGRAPTASTASPASHRSTAICSGASTCMTSRWSETPSGAGSPPNSPCVTPRASAASSSSTPSASTSPGATPRSPTSSPFPRPDRPSGLPRPGSAARPGQADERRTRRGRRKPGGGRCLCR